MFFLVQKFEHECLIEDVFEGDDLTSALSTRYDEAIEKDEIVMGCDFVDTDMSKDDFIEWVKEDNYEFTTVWKSELPISPETI